MGVHWYDNKRMLFTLRSRMAVTGMKLFFLGGAPSSNGETEELLRSSMRAVGTALAGRGREIVLCSPYEGSVDLEVLRGIAESNVPARIEMHFPATRENIDSIRALSHGLGIAISEFPHSVDIDSDESARRYGWLLAQLSALDASHIVIAAGGKPTGSANMLLHLAEARRYPILPLGHLGGAAARCLERQRYALEDRIGPNLTAWLYSASPTERVSEAIERLATPARPARSPEGELRRFFISYPRERASEADVVEMLLRRRGHEVFRDDHLFDPNGELPQEIDRAIRKSNVFIALWSVEYACSPWCYDEMSLAIELRNAKALSIWLFQLDDTRIVPPGARSLIAQPCFSRENLESTMLKLLST